MATVISKEEFDAHQADLLDRAWAGEEIVIERSGGAKLRLLPGQPAPSRRCSFGMLKGRVSLSLAEALEPLPPGYDGWPEEAKS